MRFSRNFVLVLVVVVQVLFGCSSEPEETTQASQDADTQVVESETPIREDIVETESASPSSENEYVLIAPNMSRTFTLTVPVPFLHATDHSSSLEIEYAITGNSWEDKGLQVMIDNSFISPNMASIWTVRSDISTATEIIKQYSPLDTRGYKAAITMGHGDTLVETGRPWEFREQGNNPLFELRQKWNVAEDVDDALFELKTYAFYQASITFTVVCPDEDSLSRIDKESNGNFINLAFWPRHVAYNNGLELQERDISKDSHRTHVPVTLDKEMSGCKGISIRTASENFYELTSF